MPAEATAATSLSASELQLRLEELAGKLRSKCEECEEGLRREAAVAQILSAISEPNADLAHVFNVLIEKAAQLCTASYGYVWLYDGEHVRTIAAFAQQPFRDWLRDRDPFAPAEGSALSQAILHKRLVHVVDATEHEFYQNSSRFRELIDKGGVRTLLHVPLCRGGDVLGVITVYRQERQPFSDRQLALLESFAAQAVIALENARLLGDLRERTGELARSVDELTATSDVLKIISRSSVDLITVLDTLVETASRLCGANHATMFRWRDELFHMVASHGLTDEGKHFYVTHPIAPDRGTVVGRVALERRPVHIVDVLKDPHYTYWEGQTLIGFRTMLGIPLLREEQLIGVFVINRIHAEPFTDKDIELVTTFADQAVIAIENARLFQELHDSQAELRVTIDNMGGGVAMFDADLRLTAWNRNIQQILELSDEDLAARPSYDDYLRMLADRGEYGTENVEATLSGFLEDPGEELRLERVRPDGTVVEVRRNPVPGGGFVVIYIDITERKKAEAEIAAARDAAEAALERQTATADILKVIASSQTDVQPVLDVVARAAVQFCGATDAIIHLRDGDQALCAAHEGTLRAAVGTRRQLDRQTTFGRAMVDRRTIHVPDVEALDPVEFAMARRLAGEFGFRAVIGAPLLREGTAIGAITLRRVEPGAFTPQQVELLETFAAQAIIAIENVRLFNELKDSLEQQTATAEILKVISQSPTDVQPVLDAVAKAARRFCGAANVGVILRDGPHIFPAAHDGLLDPGSLGRLYELDRTTGMGRSIIDACTIQIPDLLAPEAGTTFNYNSGNSHLLSTVLTKLTGRNALEFARERLFAPLGIEDVVWRADPQGISGGGYGLYLRPRDMAKIGYLYLRNGMWEGQRLLPEGWIEGIRKASVVIRQDWAANLRYGQQFWVIPRLDAYLAAGHHLQLIVVMPKLDIVVVATGSSRFSARDGSSSSPAYSFESLVENVVPAVKSEGPLPLDPVAMAYLAGRVRDVATERPGPVGGPSDLTKVISGKTYRFAANELNINSITLNLDEPQPSYEIEIDSGRLSEVAGRFGGPIGFDGHYRVGGRLPYGPSACRAAWLADGTSFVLEVQTLGNDDSARVTHVFREKMVEVILEAASGFRIKLQGQAED